MTDRILLPELPIFAPDTPLQVCQWLHALTEREFQEWPRRNVLYLARWRFHTSAEGGRQVAQTLSMN